MITVKAPNVMEASVLRALETAVDGGLVMLVMDPEHQEPEPDDLIGRVTEVANLGVDLEVAIEVLEPHRFITHSVFVFMVTPSGHFVLVQKQAWEPQPGTLAE